MKKQLYRLLAMVLTLLLILGAFPTGVLAVGGDDDGGGEPGYWVVDPANQKDVTIERVGNTLVMDNGIIQRTIDLEKNAVTTSFRNLFKNWELVATPETEAVIGIDGTNYPVGGTASNAFQYKGFEILDETAKDFDWTPADYTTKVNPWPALGKSLILTYDAPESLGDMQVKVRYDVYKGISVLSKVATLINNSGREVRVTYMACDKMTVNAAQKDMLYVESNYNGGSDMNANRKCSYSWSGNTISMAFDIGPDWPVADGETMDSFRAYELLHSVTYTEWKLVEVKNMYSIVAPWTNENPLFLHLISNDPAVIKKSVDSCAEVGFDMIIQSFGSGINLESQDPNYIAKIKDAYDYAHQKGIEIGGYTLAVVKDYKTVTDPWANGGPGSGILRCLYTEWSEDYWNNIHNFMTQVGSDMIEIDGPYHFYTCDVSGQSEAIQEEHKHHTYENSRYAQWLTSTKENFAKFKEEGVFINAPDWMFLAGSNKAGIGYRENGWSQPRQEQLILGRMYNYNGTFIKNPSMGWSFVPIEVYHGGGDAARFEPLDKNLKDYEWAIAQAVASGVTPCYRGKELFDTEDTKNIVKYWVDINTRYRALLNSNTVHFLMPHWEADDHTRTTGIDGIMQAFNDPSSKEKAFIMLFNQTDTARTETITIPMFFTGLTDLKEPPCPVPYSHPKDSTITGAYAPGFAVSTPSDTHYAWPAATATDRQVALYQEGELDTKTNYTIDTNGNIQMTITIPAMSYTWFVGADPTETLDAPISYPGNPRDVITDGGAAPAPTDPFNAGDLMVLDDADDSLAYTGSGWSHTADTGSVKDTISRTTTPGDTVTINFSGKEITLVTEAGYASGQVEILLDGQSTGVATWQQSVTEKRQVVWKAVDLEDKEHTLVLKNVSGELAVDAFLVEDPYAILGLTLNSGAGSEATLYRGGNLGYTLEIPDTVDLSDYTLSMTVEPAGAVEINENARTISVAESLSADTTVQIQAVMTGDGPTYHSPPVTVYAKTAKVQEWKALNQTSKTTWAEGTVNMDDDGVLTMTGSGFDSTLVNQLFAPQKGTISLEMKVSGSGCIPGLLLNAAPDSYSDTAKQQALRILFRSNNSVSLERSGTSGSYAKGTAQYANDEWVSVRCVFDAGRVQVFVNDDMVLDCKDEALKAGGGNIGLFLWANEGAANQVQFRNIEFSNDAAYYYLPTPISVQTIAGTEPVLPGTVQLTDGSMVLDNEPVAWDPIDPDCYATPGTFTVGGTVTSLDLRVEATVTVQASASSNWKLYWMYKNTCTEQSLDGAADPITLTGTPGSEVYDQYLIHQAMGNEAGTLTCKLKVNGVNTPGILLNATDNKQDAIRIYLQGNKVQLTRSGLMQPYFTGTYTRPNGQWIDVEVVYENGHVQLFLDNQEIFDVEDEDLIIDQGNAGIFLYDGNGSNTLEIQDFVFTPKPTPVDGVTLNQKEAELTVGESLVLNATVTPADATVQTVTWSSDHPDIASISNGRVTALKEGTAVIQVKTDDGDFTDQCTIQVHPAPESQWILHRQLRDTVTEETPSESDGTVTLSGSNTSDLSLLHKTLGKGAGILTCQLRTDGANTPGILLNTEQSTDPNAKLQAIRIYLRSNQIQLTRSGLTAGKEYKVVSYTRPDNQWIDVRVVYENGRVQLFLDGQEIFNVENEDLIVDQGNAGFFLYDGGNKNLEIRNFSFTPMGEHTHAGTLVPGTPVTCTESGAKDYYTCSCGKYFENAACTVEIADPDAWKVIPATGHSWSDSYLQENADAEKHYHVCTVCGTRDEGEAHQWNVEGDTEKFCTICGYVAQVQPPHTHKGALVSGTPATCAENGTKDYYTCSCGKYFEDAACTVEIADLDAWKVIPATGHSWSDSYLKENADAEKHYHVCTVCGAPDEGEVHQWNVEAATEETDKHCNICGYVAEAQLSHTHEGTLVPGTPATCTENGAKDYYTCSCGKYFEDATCTVEITNLAAWKVIPAGHTPGPWQQSETEHWRVCTVCDLELERSAHDFGGGSTCGVCGYRKSTGTGGGTTTVTRYAITVTQAEGGTISPDSARVARGGSKTFTITPDEGFRIVDVLVDGVSVGAVTRYTFDAVREGHTITAVFAEEDHSPAPVGGFADVWSDDWYAEAVQFALDQGLMNGTSADRFTPLGGTTRGMIATMLYRMAGAPAMDGTGSAFTDVPENSYYADAIAWAARTNVVNGYLDGTFRPDDPITREQLAAMLYRYAKQCGADVSQAAALNGFQDSETVSAYAVEALQWAAGSGIVTGRTGGILDPQAGATRAETATMLMRFCETFAK